MTSRRSFLIGLGAALAAPAIVRAEVLMPVRRIILPPDRWVEADGRALDRRVYADLFAAMGTAFGAGDGRTTFNVPDLRGHEVEHCTYVVRAARREPHEYAIVPVGGIYGVAA